MKNINKIVGIILIGGALVCLTLAGKQYLRYDSANQEYEELADNYTKTDDDTSNNPETDEKPFSIDWSALQTQNPDIIGWIRMDSGANYPVVKGQDNSFYLNHGFSKNYSINGSIFMSSLNSGIWNDYNTVVYGHNMNNGSMFGRNKKYMDRNFLNEHPYFYIYVPGKCYTYRIYTTMTVNDSSEAYQTVFTGPDDYRNYIDLMNEMKSYDTGTDKVYDRPTVTLSTCTKGDKRFVIQGYLYSEVTIDETVN